MHKFIQYFFLSVCLLFELNSQAQIINTLDPNFKEMLLYSNIDNSIAKDSLNNDIKIDINNNSEIEISEALRVFSLDVPSSIITSLEGIALFTNLRYLSCDLNPIDTLDVRSLSNLVTLNCSNGNLLRSLNVNGLSNLAELNCYGNLLSSLELNGLSNLKILGCSNNQLNSLDVSGLSSLERLYCSNNQLNSLEVSILSNLISLECSENPLGSIDVSNLTSLEFLGCIYNQLSSLDVSNLSSLEILACSYNQLSSLDVNRLIKIKYLYCSDNKLNSLNVNALNNLVNLDCAGNQLKSLNISGLSNLVTLNCTNNQLYSLTISGLLNLDDLRCGGNQLISIYMNNGNIFPLNYFFSPNPNLRYICVDGLMVNSINNRLFLEGINNVTVNPFCSTTLNGTHYSLNGNAIYDANSDGCTSSDSNFPYLQLKKKNALDSSYSIADNQGNFSMTLDSGTYTLTPLMPNNYYNCTPLSTTVTFPEDTIPQQFCITPNGTHHDVSVNIIPIRAARPGFSDATYKMVLKNNGNQIENGTVLFNYDESRQDYISSMNTPSNIQSGQLTFTFSNLQLFETREITVTMRTNAPTDNPAVNAGDVLNLSVALNLENSIVDEYLADNFQVIKQTVIGSFDPNDKTCLEGDIITPTIVGDFVNYLIRFENTGTANAENIVVTDFIDLNTFDISTLEITSTSHNCKTLISNGNKVQFVFDNINLPFTEPLKHGYVAFKLKLKNNLGIGDSLKNKADIYFDYNLPITTNTAASRIDNVTAIKTNANKEGSLSLYPNPSNGNFTVNFESPVRQTIIVKIVAINGNVVYEQNLYHNYQSQLQLNQNLPAGVYLITVNSEKEQYTQKLIITK